MAGREAGIAGGGTGPGRREEGSPDPPCTLDTDMALPSETRMLVLVGIYFSCGAV